MTKKTEASGIESWPTIGTVVGNTSTDTFTFILQSHKAKQGDIVAALTEVPDDDGKKTFRRIVWGRIISINRFNPFFPAESAQELASEDMDLLDTVLSATRDHLEASVLILGTSSEKDIASGLMPLSYPAKPSEQVRYPEREAVDILLTGEKAAGEARLGIGTLIGRRDIEVSLGAREIVSRHLAILAMTGGGKTVAARRIIRELIDIRYPLIVIDPHGDYLGLYEKRAKLGADIKVFYPVIRVREDNREIVRTLIEKMGQKLTDAQSQLLTALITYKELTEAGVDAIDYIQGLIDMNSRWMVKKRKKESGVPDELEEIRPMTYNAVNRSLETVLGNLKSMRSNNERLRSHKRFSSYEFTEMPDPSDAPDEIVRPGQVSIFYLAGYDHLNQSAIVSILLESLFNHRATLSNIIPPFQAIIEEAHNFIPSRREGTDETPSLPTIRKMITEGRKFGTGLVVISQRPSRLDETTLAQCNSFLVLRLVNPADKRFVRSVMENLSEDDANVLQTFGKGQGIVSGQAVRFPLLVQVKFDEDLVSDAIGDENFLEEARDWEPSPRRSKADAAVEKLSRKPSSSGRKGRRKLKKDGIDLA